MRLDQALVAQGLARSRSHAHQLIRSGQVTVDGTVVDKPSYAIAAGVRLQAARDPYVSRAAYKLIGALDASATPVPDRVLDAGASTGGFTQVLLERGAERVYAVDVGHDQLAPVVRDDPRVVVHEGVNLRGLELAHLDGERVPLVVADVSFISLRMLLDPLLGVLDPAGTALLMVKPQFEVGRTRLGAGGVVRSAADRDEAVAGVVAEAARHGWVEDWRGESPLPGPAGNVEIFVRLVPTKTVGRLA